ncbi:hypothetical protein QBC43DRAFT_282977 [Cladorrhinum sp. PSN259]|nr:hypothetical protein QBC43DRAFT_282977 [Cladorrhinum sp. PSN259]
MDSTPENLFPRSLEHPERNPWSTTTNLPPNHPSPKPNNLRVPPSSSTPNSKTTKSKSRRVQRETSSSGAWSHKAEPPSAPSEIAPDDAASTYTQRLVHSRYGVATPTQAQQYHADRGFEDVRLDGGDYSPDELESLERRLKRGYFTASG